MTESITSKPECWEDGGGGACGAHVRHASLAHPSFG